MLQLVEDSKLIHYVSADCSFRILHGTNPKKLDKEFYKQLKAQEEGINNLTVSEYLQNRKIYTDLSRSYGQNEARKILTNSGKAQSQARKKLEKEINRSIRESLAKKNIFGAKAKEIAAAKTKAQMKNLAALHDPDLIAGGNDEISRLGNKHVNSSLGSHWAKDERVNKMDTAAEKELNNSGPDTKMNVKLERCK